MSVTCLKHAVSLSLARWHRFGCSPTSIRCMATQRNRPKEDAGSKLGGRPIGPKDTQIQGADAEGVSQRERLRSVIIPPNLIEKLEQLKLRPPKGPKPRSQTNTKSDVEMHEMFTRRVTLGGEASTQADFPNWDISEVAFAGRSNVGKSTLVNKLVGRWNLAKVENKPGVTQTLNFYNLSGRLGLVDLPGYGFAFASDDKKTTWVDLMHVYLRERKSLQRVFVLIDARHGFKPSDRDFLDFLDGGSVKYQTVVTKCDMVPTGDLARRMVLMQQELSTRRQSMEPFLAVSRHSESSLAVLRSQLAFLSRRASPRQ
eukprot:comp124115_c0_seq1/m.49062 comp124115_c0_seq1/g.49062  ORF comp124115_c0_seq1/g.49062 comp124115_c0_seq1/m.49062 type:complete len:314 (-) comp124115_c0_seq1:2-943(-)